MKNTEIETSAKPTYFVASGEWGVPSHNPWAKTKAKTLDGAKRLAAKLPRALTATVRVAVEDAQSNIKTVATLSDASAITRRRPIWRDAK